MPAHLWAKVVHSGTPFTVVFWSQARRMRKKYDPREFQRQLERRNEAARLAAAEFAKAAEKAAQAPEGGAVAAAADAAEKPRHDADPDPDSDVVGCFLEEAVESALSVASFAVSACWPGHCCGCLLFKHGTASFCWDIGRLTQVRVRPQEHRCRRCWRLKTTLHPV